MADIKIQDFQAFGEVMGTDIIIRVPFKDTQAAKEALHKIQEE